jgi:uncharacterized protein YecE (DUF72 family)
MADFDPAKMAVIAPIRIGIGGWGWAGWRGGVFYPTGLPQARELEYAASRLGAIEIEATYYRLQTPDTFSRWRAATPDGFVFALKGSRFCTNRRDLGTAVEGIANFFRQGIERLEDRLGPVLWQLAATKRFDAAEIAAFLALLPATVGWLPLRHAIEPRHASFADPAFYALAAAAGVTVVTADHPDYPRLEAPPGQFAYARLMRARETAKAGYPPRELREWAGWARDHAQDGRETFMFAINGAKDRAPAVALALIGQTT